MSQNTNLHYVGPCVRASPFQVTLQLMVSPSFCLGVEPVFRLEASSH